MNYPQLEAELERDEGEKLRCYTDSVGCRTIGVGRNLDAKGITPDETKRLGITIASVLAHGITTTESGVLLQDDIAVSEAQLDAHLPWWRNLSDGRQRALVNMTFNMGIGNAQHGLLSFNSTLAFIKAGLYAEAARSMLASKWAAQVGARAQRLAALIEKG